MKFKSSETWREQLTVPCSGSAGSPITFGAYGDGAKPVISGADVISGWTSASVTANTNLTPYPEAMASWDSGQSYVTWTNNVSNPLSPKGTATADGVTITADNNTHFISDLVDSNSYSAKDYTWSFFGRSGTSFRDTYVSLNINYFNSSWGILNIHQVTFNISGGTVYSNLDGFVAQCYDAGDRWFRCSFTDAAPTNSKYVIMQFIFRDGSGISPFAGDNSTIHSYIWGVVGENSTTLSAYESATVYYADFSVANFQPSRVITQNGTRLQKTRTASFLFPGQFGFDYSPNHTYIRTTGDDNPSGYTILGYKRKAGIYASGKNYITIDGLSFTGHNRQVSTISDNADIPAGVIFDIPDVNGAYGNWIVQNCDFLYEGEASLKFYYLTAVSPGNRTVSGVLIQNNTFTQANWARVSTTTLLSMWTQTGDHSFAAVQIKNNVIAQDLNLNPYNDERLGGWYVPGCNGLYIHLEGDLTNEISGNTVTGTQHGIIVEGYSNTSNLGKITKNLIHDTADDFIWVRGQFNALEISYNVGYNGGDNFIDTWRESPTNNQQSNLHIYNNVFYNTANSGVQLAKTENAIVKNNIFYNFGAGGTNSSTAEAQVMIKVYETDNGSQDITIPSLTCNNNLYYNTVSTRFRVDNSTQAAYLTLEQWETTESKSFDADSLTSDPLFVSTTIPNFHLQPTSPAINAGTSVGLTSDYAGIAVPQGSAPDIGAYEYQTVSSTSSNSNSSGTSTASTASGPNIHSGWSYKVMAGPSYQGQADYISGQGEANAAMTFIANNAHHDDIYVTLDRRNPDYLRGLTKPLPQLSSQGLSQAGEIYEFKSFSSFNGYPITQFDNPVTVILPYEPAKLNGSSPKQLRIAWYDTDSGRWKVLSQNSVLSEQNHTLANTTKKFSYFTVVYPNSISVLGASTKLMPSVPTLIPTPQPTPTQSLQSTTPNQISKPKYCFWFICW